MFRHEAQDLGPDGIPFRGGFAVVRHGAGFGAQQGVAEVGAQLVLAARGELHDLWHSLGRAEGHEGSRGALEARRPGVQSPDTVALEGFRGLLYGSHQIVPDGMRALVLEPGRGDAGQGIHRTAQGHRHGGGIDAVRPGEDAEQHAQVLHAPGQPGHGAETVQGRHRVGGGKVAVRRRNVGQQPGLRDQARGGPQAGDAGAVRRPADGAAKVGAEPEGTHARGHGRAVPARGTARREAGVPGVPGFSEERVAAVRFHREFRTIALAQQHRARLLQAPDRRRGPLRNVVPQKGTSRRRPQSLGGQRVLHCERHAVQWAKEPALGRSPVRGRRFLGGQRVEGNDGVQAGVIPGDPLKVQFQAFDGGQPAFPQGDGPLDHG